MSMEDGFVPGYGNGNAQLIVVGEAPARTELLNQRPLVGPTGKEHGTLLKHAGISRNEVFETNAFPWRCPGDTLKNQALTGHSFDEGAELLWRDILTIRPNCILALGNHALSTLTGKSGITKWRGSILRSLKGNIKVIPTIHPAVLFKQGQDGKMWPYQTRAYIQLDYRRAVEESKDPRFNLPSRELVICKGSDELATFLRQYKDRKRWMYDIEVMKCIPTCIAIACNRYHALCIPLLPLEHLRGHIPMTRHDRREMVRLLARFLEREDKEWCGQNTKFDHEKMYRPWSIRMPRRIAHDTLLLQHVLNPEFPKRLDFISSIYTREPYYKDELKEFNPKYDHLDQYYLYNAKDAAVQMECLEEMLKEADELGLREFYETIVTPQHELYMAMEQNGFGVDYEKRQQLYEKYTDLELQMEEELCEIAEFRVNVRSPKDVPLLLYQGLELPVRKKNDEDSLVALLGNSLSRDVELRRKQERALNLIIDLRRVKLTKSKIAAPLDYDGRARTSFRLGGTETGRRATSTLKAPVRPHPMGIASHSLTKHGKFGGDLRTMYVPTNGCDEFLEIDLKQAEARIVALLADDDFLLEQFAKGRDIHRMTANWLFGVHEDKIGKDQRFIGKMTRHGGAYGMGKRRHMVEVNTSARRFELDVKISEYRAGKNLETFHRHSPKIRSVYHHEIEELLEVDRTLVNPYGRRRTFFERWGKELFKEAYAHIPQSTVPDHLIQAAFRIRARLPWLQFVNEAHDSLVVQYMKEARDEVAGVMKEEMEKPIDFERCSLSRGIVIIPCDIQIGPNYGELTEYEVD
jgi:uracil-DNA glycosylase family 4